MSRIALVCDSTADLPEEAIRSLSVEVVPLNVHFDDQVFRDYVDISPEQFLERLENTSVLPTTSQPSPAAFAEAYDRVSMDADAIVVLTISSKLSGTWQSARLGIDIATSDVPVHVIDSLSASTGLGLQVRRARDLVDCGLPIDQIVGTLEREAPRYQLTFFADTLEFLQRGGRIGRASMMIGSLLQVKPILACELGTVVPVERTRTRSRAIDGLIDIANANQSAERVGILHDGRHHTDLERVTDGVRGLAPEGEIYTNQYGPIIATHVGPGALGVCVFRHSD
jgi:DegV family protein with EDD domain